MIKEIEKNNQLEGSIYELFGYTLTFGLYTNGSGMKELGVIGGDGL